MLFTFDFNHNYEYPTIELCNPDLSQQYIIQETKNLTITPRFNSVSEVSFSIYSQYNNVIFPYYDYVKKNKVLHIEGWGYWLIDTTTETFDGSIPLKEVHAYSYEYVLNYKGINVLDGTYKLYSQTGTIPSLLESLMVVAPKWSIGHVDTELWNEYRTFDVPDANLYGFLMDDVSTSYEVIFVFDNENLTINAYAPKNVVKNNNIMLTFDNVNKSINIEELATDIYTVLRVNGADNLSISTVNPLGDNRLFNFSYYMSTEWMPQSLIDRITAWNNLVNQQRTPYANLFTALNTKQRELLKLQTELRDLQAELSALEVVRKNLVDQPAQLKAQTAKVNAKEKEIRDKKVAITNKETEITNTRNSLTVINNKVAYDKYFTEAERKTLDPFIIEANYTNEDFIVTDQMRAPADADGDTLILTTVGMKKIKDLTASDIIINENYMAQQLYDQGLSMLDKVSQPSFTFSLDTVNFLFMEKFKPFAQQIELGSIIHVEITEGNWVTPFLIEMTINYDSPTDFNMVFGNRFRLQDSEWTFADLHNENLKTASQVGTTLGVAAQPVKDGNINSINQYLADAYNAANREIQSTTDNEVSMGSYGIRLKKKDDNYASGFNPHQTWLNNNLICMTDDNWDSVKLAIGYINTTQNPNLGYYGISAEVIAGNLVAGNQLIIQDGTAGNETTFIVDANGARLTNASFILTTKDNKGKIILNPQNGIHIQTNKNGSFKDVFYVDNRGYLMATDITATGGTIGGFIIDTDNFYSSKTMINKNSLSSKKQANGTVPVIHLGTDGTGNIGFLSWNGNGSTPQARFDGAIYAQEGTIGGFTITSNRLSSTAADKKGPIIYFDSSTGHGRIGDLRWNEDENRWQFDGTVFAQVIEAGTFTGEAVKNAFSCGSFNKSNVDKIFAEHSITQVKLPSELEVQTDTAEGQYPGGIYISGRLDGQVDSPLTIWVSSSHVMMNNSGGYGPTLNDVEIQLRKNDDYLRTDIRDLQSRVTALENRPSGGGGNTGFE